jgi:hypothetical protein
LLGLLYCVLCFAYFCKCLVLWIHPCTIWLVPLGMGRIDSCFLFWDLNRADTRSYGHYYSYVCWLAFFEIGYEYSWTAISRPLGIQDRSIELKAGEEFNSRYWNSCYAEHLCGPKPWPTAVKRSEKLLIKLWTFEKNKININIKK